MSTNNHTNNLIKGFVILADFLLLNILLLFFFRYYPLMSGWLQQK